MDVREGLITPHPYQLVLVWIGIAIIFVIQNVSHRAHYAKLGSDPQSLDCLDSRGYYLGVLGPTGTGWLF